MEQPEHLFQLYQKGRNKTEQATRKQQQQV